MEVDESIEVHFEYLYAIREKARALSICYPPEDMPDAAVEDIALSSILIREEIADMLKIFGDNFTHRLTLPKAGDQYSIGEVNN